MGCRVDPSLPKGSSVLSAGPLTKTTSACEWDGIGSLLLLVIPVKLECVRAVLAKCPLLGTQPSAIPINTHDFIMSDVVTCIISLLRIASVNTSLL